MSLYELAILGCITAMERATLTATLRGRIEDFGLAVGDDVLIHDSTTIAGRDKRAAFAATYFGGGEEVDLDVAHEVVASSAPIIPTVIADGDFRSHIPEFLQSANGLKRRQDDPKMAELASALLECVGLLRRQRRVFVSYRRIESRAAALQLHDVLTARGFDVFLGPVDE